MSPKKQRQEKIWASGKSWNQDLRIRKHDPGDETFTVTHLHFSVHASFLLSLRFGSIYSLSTWTSHSPSVYLFSPNASCPHVQPLFLSRTSADTGLFTTQDTACSPENMRDETHPSLLRGPQEGQRGLHCTLPGAFSNPSSAHEAS